MELNQVCPVCHTSLPPNSYFCFNCGKQLRTPPLTTYGKIKIYLVSLLLPPFGLWYLYKYYKSNDPASKKAGVIAAFITTVSLIVTIWLTIIATSALTKTVNEQINATYSEYGL